VVVEQLYAELRATWWGGQLAGVASSLVKHVSEAFLGLLSPTITLVSTFTPSGGQTTASLLALGSSGLDQENDGTGKAHQKQLSNAGPVQWLTAIERKWYYERGLTTPAGAWMMCTEGDEAFDYLLISGVCELDVAPPYESGASSKNDTVSRDRRERLLKTHISHCIRH
jgi:hypothetical protein